MMLVIAATYLLYEYILMCYLQVTIHQIYLPHNIIKAYFTLYSPQASIALCSGL